MTKPVTPEEVMAALYPKRKNKFRAVKTTVDSISFASKAESKRYCELKLLERAGKIYDLVCQPQFTFQINGEPLVFPNGKQARYTGDFQYYENGQLVVEDHKSDATKTEAYVLRVALFRALYPKIVFVETGGKKKTKSDNGWIVRRNMAKRSAA